MCSFPLFPTIKLLESPASDGRSELWPADAKSSGESTLSAYFGRPSPRLFLAHDKLFRALFRVRMFLQLSRSSPPCYVRPNPPNTPRFVAVGSFLATRRRNHMSGRSGGRAGQQQEGKQQHQEEHPVGTVGWLVLGCAVMGWLLVGRESIFNFCCFCHGPSRSRHATPWPRPPPPFR